MFNFYPTPESVLNVFRSHLPRNPVSILDPAAGEGDLVSFVPRLYSDRTSLTLIDIDSKKTKMLKSKYQSAKTVHADFLNWAPTPNTKFDLILLNPPFSSRSESWLKFENNKVPIEAAITLKSIKMLSDMGLIIAILPDSIITSDRLAELRKSLSTKICIKYCYQLPEGIFKGVESRFFVLIGKKGVQQKKIVLRKVVSQRNSSEVSISHNLLGEEGVRLDFDFHNSSKEIFRMFSAKAGQRLSKNLLSTHNFTISRGPVRENYKSPNLVHTTDYLGFFWKGFVALSKEKRTDLKEDDFYVVCKRVSRGANYTLGLLPRSNIKHTDCVFTFRHSQWSPMRLLFNLRILMSHSVGEKRYLRGSGAKYLSARELTKVPQIDFAEMNFKLFEEYMDSYISLDDKRCLRIEQLIRVQSDLTIIKSSSKLEVSGGEKPNYLHQKHVSCAK